MVTDQLAATGPVATDAVRVARELMGPELVSRDHEARWRSAAERMVRRIEDGETAYRACPAIVPSYGRALLVATDRRLLGDGQYHWTAAGDTRWNCDASWGDLEDIRECPEDLDLRDEPTHWLRLAGCPWIELCHVPLATRCAFLRCVISCAIEALL